MSQFVNVFDLVNNYIDTNSTGFYCDIKSSNIEDKIGQLLNGAEREAYYQIKAADNNRLMTCESYGRNNQQGSVYSQQPQQNVYMPGIGNVAQLC